MREIQDKVAIVTGSSSGVGAATAELLATHGFRVVVNYNSNDEGANKTATACEAAGSEAIIVKGNVAEDADCKAMAQAALDKWGRIDVLVNNAGTTKFVEHSDLGGLEAADFQRIYGVNVIGAYQMIRAVQPAMAQSEEGGAVVNVASTAGVTGIGSSVAYAASKGAMITMTLSLARALGPSMRINAICPGFIAGDWLREGLGDEQYQKVMDFNIKNAPLGATATPASVADGILMFISGTQIVTGETLILDGGRHLSMAPLGRR
ncbi:MAG: SDR family NAD(P)-dependent oxidoreductase [Pseudohongiellaceae bacterium]